MPSRRRLLTPPRQYVTILFDFEKPGERDLIESILRFAAVSRFVVADLKVSKTFEVFIITRQTKKWTPGSSEPDAGPAFP